jgi:hypothetical protein
MPFLGNFTATRVFGFHVVSKKECISLCRSDINLSLCLRFLQNFSHSRVGYEDKDESGGDVEGMRGDQEG